MSSIMNYNPSLNTITTCATAVCAAEIVFRKWGIRYFSKDSQLGRAILHGLDISQYLLGTAGLLSHENGKSVDFSTILIIGYFIPSPLIAKSICYLTDSKSKIYLNADSVVQAARICAKIACFLESALSLSKDKTSTKQVINIAKVAVLGLELIWDAAVTLECFPRSLEPDFYKFLRKRAVGYYNH